VFPIQGLSNSSKNLAFLPTFLSVCFAPHTPFYKGRYHITVTLHPSESHPISLCSHEQLRPSLPLVSFFCLLLFAFVVLLAVFLASGLGGLALPDLLFEHLRQAKHLTLYHISQGLCWV
jgi:hypothetical protein